MMEDVDAISRWCFADPLLLHYEHIAANLRLCVSPTPAPSPFPAKSLCTIHLLHHVPSFTSPQLPRLCSTPVPCFANSPLPSPDAWFEESTRTTLVPVCSLLKFVMLLPLFHGPLPNSPPSPLFTASLPVLNAFSGPTTACASPTFPPTPNLPR